MNSPSVVRSGVYYRFNPLSTPVPLLVDVSRSGREYPPEFRSPVPFTTLHDNVSMYVDELFGNAPRAGGTLLYACFPAMFIDSNRSAADIDETLIDGVWPGPVQKSDFTGRGLGLIKRLSRYGEPVQEKKLSVEELTERIELYHEPYHQELSNILRTLREKHGFALQLSCHCMSAVGAPTHADPGKPRADFNLGDCHGATCSQETMNFVVETLKKLGHSVSINFPYYGGELIHRHSAPKKGIESVFIEVNKKLFIDTKTFKKTAGFPAVKSSIDQLLLSLAEYAHRKSGSKVLWTNPGIDLLVPRLDLS